MQNIRTKCLKKLCDLDVNHQRYFEELEETIYDFANRPKTVDQNFTYYTKYVQLYYNLSRHLQYITSTYEPSQLVYLSELELNPDVKKEREEYEKQNKKYMELRNHTVALSENDGNGNNGDDDDDDEDGTVQCPRCKNKKKMIIISRQLRSADEPASLFITCSKCSKQWRIG